MAYGFIYIAINDCMPGLVKIGYTRGSPTERVAALSSSSGVPVPFSLFTAYEVKYPSEIESLIHQILSDYRENDKREFFRVCPMKAHETIMDHVSVETWIETFEFAYRHWKAKDGKNQNDQA